MARPTVYIIQEPLKRDLSTGEMIPTMDFRKVLDYGDPVVLLNSGRVSLSPGPTVDMLRDKLRNFTDEDFLVSVGDPSAIFIAAMVVGEVNRGRCQLLKWDKNSKQYITVQIDLHHHRRNAIEKEN